MEFVPDNTTVDNWSKIFTAIRIAGKSVSSEYLVDWHIEKMDTHPEAKTFHAIYDTRQYDNYSVSTATIQYALSGQNEIIYTKYFSGPTDVSGVQYTERLSNSLTSEEFDIKVDEMKNFFDAMIEVIEF